MIPIFRTRNMERAASWLIQRYRHVLIYCAYDNYTRIRFRPDLVDDPRIYFNKVPSQHRRWRETGGALVTWKRAHREGHHDAVLIAEWPASFQELKKTIRDTACCAVLYYPPTWRPHEEKILHRFPSGSPKHVRHTERLDLMKVWASNVPWFTKSVLPRLPLSQAVVSRSWSAPELPEDAERSSGTRN